MLTFKVVYCLVAASFLSITTGRVTPVKAQLLRRDAFEVSRQAHLGESFAAGNGAGQKYDKTKCSRFDKSWGLQVNQDERLRGPSPKQFDFLACSGAKLINIHGDTTLEDISSSSGSSSGGNQPKEAQAAQLGDSNPDLVTMSIGGNDVDFVYLLDHCVYRFYNPGCGGCGKFLSFDDCSSDCETAMNDIQKTIADERFTRQFSRAIQTIFEKAPHTHLFITGYPRFFNAETDQCDHVSFKWLCSGTNRVLPLIKHRRQRMNDLTIQLNDKIKAIINSWAPGPSITFVDTDPFFEGHRFCEEGTKEPSYRNDNIYFFPLEYYTNDNLLFDANNVASGDCQALLDAGGDQADYFLCEIANSVHEGNEVDLYNSSSNVDGADVVTSSSGSGGTFGRLFHPTINGNTAYKDAIMAMYSIYEASGQPASPPSAPSGPGVQCKGLEGNAYIARSTLSDLITNTYCPKLQSMTSSIGTGHYLDGTPEDVEISAIKGFSANGAPTPDECVKNFHRLLDECDNDSTTNPVDWKAGGSVEVDGWTYTITPTGQRPSTPKAWCKIENCQNGEKCTASIWGAGWLKNDYGEKLRGAFAAQQAVYSELRYENSLGDSKGIDMSQWDFKYEALDEHEWHASLLLDLGLRLPYKKTVTDALRSAAGDGLEIGNGGDCESEVNY